MAPARRFLLSIDLACRLQKGLTSGLMTTEIAMGIEPCKRIF